MKRALVIAIFAATFSLSTAAPSIAAPASSAASKQPKKTATTAPAPSGNPMLTPRMMDRKRPMNPVCAQGFKPGAPSNCHY
ncbi:hypothetical protein QTL95_22840 [Rhizobium sp. S152]|uniref:hypothetical protein n=1 Tax=Rhizobium sp. S152 TaxID=3055038 RepID=UPI0025A94B35|nr:hypothetical protein [Rhizobium sp. S152]MDM9628735.1 hypothetical protein [Rhizobium sp. S152]